MRHRRDERPTPRIRLVVMAAAACLALVPGSQAASTSSDSIGAHPILLFRIGSSGDSLISKLSRLGARVGDYTPSPGNEAYPRTSDPADLRGRLNRIRGDVVISLDPARFLGVRRCVITLYNDSICFVGCDHEVSPARDSTGTFLTPAQIWPRRIGNFRTVLRSLEAQLGAPEDGRADLANADAWYCYRVARWRTSTTFYELCLRPYEEEEICLDVTAQPVKGVNECIHGGITEP